MDGMHYLLDKNANLKLRKMMGRSFLQSGRLEDALETYVEILDDFPHDVDVLCILGNLYLFAGFSRTAEALYLQILEAIPDSVLITRQLSLARENTAKATMVDAVEADGHPRDPFTVEAIQHLFEKLQSFRESEHFDEICQAADMLEKTMKEDDALQHSPGIPRQIDTLLPALVDLNIRQARAADCSDLTEVLLSLQVALRPHSSAVEQPSSQDQQMAG